MKAQNRGFTLIELVIAIFILVVAIVGVYNSFSTVVILTAGAGSRLTAAYLAQEGIEIVRNMRDNNWLKMEEYPGTIWTDGLLGCEDGCEADYRTDPCSGLVVFSGRDLKINNNGFYSYDETDVSIETKFKRKITIIPQDDNVLKILVLVTWDVKEEIFDIEAEEYLYDWY